VAHADKTRKVARIYYAKAAAHTPYRELSTMQYNMVEMVVMVK